MSTLGIRNMFFYLVIDKTSYFVFKRSCSLFSYNICFLRDKFFNDIDRVFQNFSISVNQFIRFVCLLFYYM